MVRGDLRVLLVIKPGLILRRYWSRLLAFVTVAVGVYMRGVELEPIGFQDPERVVWIVCLVCATVAGLCLVLVIHSWQTQCRVSRNKWQLTFWSHVLLFPVLTTIVLMLSAIQRSTYDLALERDQFQYLHFYSGRVKDFLIWTIPLDALLIVVWAAIAALKNKTGAPTTGRA